MKVRRIITSAVLALAMTAGVTANPALADEVAQVDPAPNVEQVDENTTVTVEVDDAEGGYTSATVVDDSAGLMAEVVVEFDAGPDADADAGAEGALELTTVAIDAVVDGEQIAETLAVESFVLLDETNFTATLRVQDTGEVLHVDTTVVEAQALPALFVLGVLARLGIKHVITWYGKTQIKSAVKSYLLNSISAHKWSHIMQARHNWHLLGARSREQIADYMGRAMAEGSHSAYGSAMKAVWHHNGRRITVTYDKASGKVSDGWVN
jgi:hypothetical protein